MSDKAANSNLQTVISYADQRERLTSDTIFTTYTLDAPYYTRKKYRKEFDRLNIFSNFGTLSITFIIGNHVSGHRSKENHFRGRLHTKSFFALFPFEIPSNPYY
ncbi:hypothetical protein CS546_07780 [Porphyromonas gingivalis]|nr:hypothetical protein CS546_07780 [Porphyromonas gingivalis]PDP55577.1 hypothetical protein CLI74_09025 [Porphyromonas gingivalis]